MSPGLKCIDHQPYSHYRGGTKSHQMHSIDAAGIRVGNKIHTFVSEAFGLAKLLLHDPFSPEDVPDKTMGSQEGARPYGIEIVTFEL